MIPLPKDVRSTIDSFVDFLSYQFIKPSIIAIEHESKGGIFYKITVISKKSGIIKVFAVNQEGKFMWCY